jgi:glutamate-1-semialdehyde aminotransferase
LSVYGELTKVEKGIYFLPVKTKQCSIAAAHSEEDIELTLRALEEKSAFLAAD